MEIRKHSESNDKLQIQTWSWGVTQNLHINLLGMKTLI